MPLILPGNVGSATAATGFNVANSCRFNRADSTDMTLSMSSGGSQTKFTKSFWVKRCKIGEQHYIYDNSGTTQIFFHFRDSDKIGFGIFNSGAYSTELISTQLFRDLSAWYHIVIAVDYTNGTQALRARIYVNGTEITAFDTETRPNNTSTTFDTFNSDKTHYIGSNASSNHYLHGYLAEVVHIDNAQLAPTSFGEFDSDSGIWKPIDVSGLTFGTNGFYLDFENSGALGADVSGNTNNFTVNNLTAIDQSTDTCTNNFATMNPLDNIGATTFSEGNNLLLWTATNKTNKSTIGVTTGKWYAECKAIDVNGGTSGTLIGVGTEANLASTYLSATTSGWGYRCQTGNIQNGAGNEAYGDTWAEDDIIGVALDMDNGAVYMSKNGTFQDSGDPTSGASKTNAANNQASYASAISGTVFFACSSYDTDSLVWNFGSPSFAISSGNTDGNGYGNFEYAVPSGYLALCTKNLGSSGG